MTQIVLLERLKEFTEEVVKDLLLPVEPREEEPNPPPRVTEVYVPGLPDPAAYKSKAPFITHEIITSEDQLELDPQRSAPGPDTKFLSCTATVRTCLCVYHENAREGRMALLTLAERLRIALLEQQVIGKQFILDLDEGRKSLFYPLNPNQVAFSPFYLGEMLTVWHLPSVERVLPYDKKGTGGLGIGRLGNCGEPGVIHGSYGPGGK